jgi:hypothetical protein
MSECRDCKLWKRQGKSHWGNCPIAECFGEVDMGADEPSCPAFDNGEYDKAVGELIEKVERFRMYQTSDIDDVLVQAIIAVEAARGGKK